MSGRWGEELTDFEQYTAEYSPELTRFCIKLCVNVEDAEDLFQDTWTRAFEKFEQYRPEYNFKNWLFAICANIFKNSKKEKYNSTKAIFNSDEEKERFMRSIPGAQKDIDEPCRLAEVGHVKQKFRICHIRRERCIRCQKLCQSTHHLTKPLYGK